MNLLFLKRIFFTIILGIIVISQAELNTDSQNPVNTEDNNTCHTKICETASHKIRRFMDKNADPCDNFYKFACGGYVKKKKIPNDASSINVLNEIDGILKGRLKDILEQEIDNNSIRPFKLWKKYYDTCMDTALIEKTSENELRKILDSIGGWPVLNESWNESNFNWENVIFKINKLGYPIDSFINVKVDIDQRNNTNNIIRISQPIFTQSKNVLLKGLNETFVQAYLNYSIALAEILGANHERAKAELEESLKFEIDLAKISLSGQEQLDTSNNYNLMTLKDLQSNYTNIPWVKYLNNLLSPYASLHSDEIMWVEAPNYLKGFSKIINKTSKRVLANYALWKLVERSTIAMGEKIQNATRRYLKVTQGIQGKEDRWKTCLKNSNDYSGYFAISAGALYVRKYFSPSSKEEVTDIINNIRIVFGEMIKKEKWMDQETKKMALQKLDAIQPIIGYPDEFLDDKKLEEYYNDLNLDTSSFLKSELSLLQFEKQQSIKTLREKNERINWKKHVYSAIVNAFYNPNDNTIDMTAGILEEHIYIKGRPNYGNYGLVGWIAGHEITHGFDTSGRQFDEKGNLRNWWNLETEKKYKKRAAYVSEAFSKEYLTIKIDNVLQNLTMNSNDTVGENIADIGGIKEAYGAYLKWEKEHGSEPKLPLLPYNAKQLFWISAATAFCDKSTPEAIKNQIYNDNHTPSEIRVTGTFSNVPEFSNDFNCSTGSRMNPEKKYSVW